MCDALIHFSSHHFTLIKLKIKSHSFFYFFFFLLLTFDGGGGFYELIWLVENWGGSNFSVSHLSLFFFFHSHSHSHSHSLTLARINLFILHSYTLFTLVINSIELIWTSPFQKYSLSFIQPRSCLTSPLSLTFTCDWVDVPHDLGFFFVPFFDHIMSVRMITSWQAVSEWELIIEP